MEHAAVEGPKSDLLIAIIASRLSRLSLKFSFSQYNNYRDNRVIFHEKRLSFGVILSRKTKQNDYHYQPYPQPPLPQPTFPSLIKSHFSVHYLQLPLHQPSLPSLCTVYKVQGSTVTCTVCTVQVSSVVCIIKE